MPIIDPDGYFGGDRFDLVSDSARLVWPSFFLASNTVARIELNYFKVVAKAFYKWKKKPTEKQFWTWVKEYQKAYLLYVYESETGQVWGQWDTDPKYLTTYKLKADLESPAPTVKEFQQWKTEYISAKKAKSSDSSNFRNFSKISKTFSAEPNGGGGGGGIGGGGGEVRADAPQAPPAAEPSTPIAINKPTRGTRFTLHPLDTEWLKFAMDKRGWTQEKTCEVYDSFSDYWISKAGADGTKLDWFATWRNWVKNERSRDGPAGGNGHYPDKNQSRRNETMQLATLLRNTNGPTRPV